jgi:hypothetical protein
MSHNYLLVNANGHPSCFNTAPSSLYVVSHLKTKIIVKLSTAKTGVVHMASFKVEKA